MAGIFDPRTIERFRSLPPRQVFEEVRDAVFQAGAAGSDAFLEAYEELVDHGILSWDQVDEFEG